MTIIDHLKSNRGYPYTASNGQGYTPEGSYLSPDEPDDRDLVWMVDPKQEPRTLPTAIFPEDAAERKRYPIFAGLLAYFPHACAAVAHHSMRGNEQHNPGEPLHWAKEKSIGNGDQIVRHLMEEDYAAMCWRSLELFERQLTGLPPFDGPDGVPPSPEHSQDGELAEGGEGTTPDPVADRAVCFEPR